MAELERLTTVQRPVNGLLVDCRHAIRLYARTPASSAIAVIVLALGIAFVGAFLSLYVDLVMRPHPGFEQSSRLATIGLTSEANGFPIPFGTVERIADEIARPHGRVSRSHASADGRSTRSSARPTRTTIGSTASTSLAVVRKFTMQARRR